MATLSSKVTPSGVATAAQGTLADTSVQPNDSPTFGDGTFTGDVGIGTTSPTDALNISSGANQIGLDTGDQATYGTLDLGHFANGAFIGTQAGSNAGSDLLRFGTSGTEHMRINASGNVGIGTSNPTVPLSVIGDGAMVVLAGSGGAYHGMQIQCADASGSATKHVFIDTLNESGASVANQVGTVFSDGGSQWSWSTQPAGTRTDRRVERMRIDSAGSVGIGTTSPDSTLDVTGNVTIGAAGAEGGQVTLRNPDGTSHGGSLDVSSADNLRLFQTANNSSMQIGQLGGTGGTIAFSTAAAERMRIDASGNVGIGTTGPGGPLDIINQAQRYMFRGGRIDCVNAANTVWGTFATQSNQVDLRTSNGTTRFQMLSSGRIYLPNASAARGSIGYPIATPNDSVANAIRANGYIEWQTDIGAVGTNYFTSDERKKENIAPATKQSSEVIEAIQFIEFDWKPDSGGEGHVDVGVSAQQLQTIDPRLVSTLSDDMLMVNEPALVSHMAKALQEALTKIEALEARLVALEAV